MDGIKAIIITEEGTFAVTIVSGELVVADPASPEPSTCTLEVVVEKELPR